MTIILLAILAHVIADFMLQSSTMVLKKNNLRIFSYLIHGLTVFGTIVFLLQGYNLESVLFYGLTVSVLHILIDFLKGVIGKAGNQTVDLAVFFADQALHLAVILFGWQFFNWRPNPVIRAFYGQLLSSKAITVFQPNYLNKGGLNLDHFLAGAIIYILVCFGGAALVRKVLNIVDSETSATQSRQKFGAIIGILERLIILTLVLNNALTAIAFILTAKSIARFSELNNKDFAEYYLIGTLISTALAISGGILLKYFVSL